MLEQKVKERGIIFSTELIPKILDGTKTQTRRTGGLKRINEKPDNWRVGSMDIAGRIIWVASHIDRSVAPKLKCPYGQVGDRLRVKETWRVVGKNTETKALEVQYRSDMSRKWCAVSITDFNKYTHNSSWGVNSKWRPSLFMPRLASRIDLEITGIRAERLQGITEEDAIAEGTDPNEPWGFFDGYINSYAWLWDSINAKRYPWEFNPWVWTIGW